jgi:hypothetical protein
VDYIAGGWQFNGIMALRNGIPYHVTVPGDIANIFNSGTYLRALVRTGDEVWRVHDRIFVMLPEADFECATNMVERLKSRAPHIVAGSDLRIAAFPEDGVTAGALLATLARGSAGRTRFTPDTARPKGPRDVSTPRTTDEAWLRRSGRSRGVQ